MRSVAAVWTALVLQIGVVTPGREPPSQTQTPQVGQPATITVRARSGRTPGSDIPTVPSVTLGVPSVSEPGPATFNACPNNQDTLGVPGVDCRVR